MNNFDSVSYGNTSKMYIASRLHKAALLVLTPGSSSIGAGTSGGKTVCDFPDSRRSLSATPQRDSHVDFIRDGSRSFHAA